MKMIVLEKNKKNESLWESGNKIIDNNHLVQFHIQVPEYGTFFIGNKDEQKMDNKY